MLQYSFWINNKGKKARWAVPLALYFCVRFFSTLLQSNNATEAIGGILIGLYLLFVLTTWLINPLANFFLLFHKDGKFAIDNTEKWTAITVVSTLLTGIVFFGIACIITPGKIYPPLMVAAMACWAMALPLGNIQYPLSFKAYTGKNKVAMMLVVLGLLTVILSFINLDIAIGAGFLLLILIVINSWVSIFK